MKIKKLLKKLLSNSGISCEKGTTLSELLVSVAILGLISTVVATFFTQATNFQKISQAKLEIQRDARECLDLMNRNIREGIASTIIIDRYNSSQPPYSRIYFENKSNDKVYFFQNGTKLCMQVDKSGTGWGGVKILAENLRYLAFSYPETDIPSLISVSLTFERSTYLGRSKALQLAIEKVRVMN